MGNIFGFHMNVFRKSEGKLMILNCGEQISQLSGISLCKVVVHLGKGEVIHTYKMIGLRALSHD